MKLAFGNRGLRDIGDKRKRREVATVRMVGRHAARVARVIGGSNGPGGAQVVDVVSDGGDKVVLEVAQVFGTAALEVGAGKSGSHLLSPDTSKARRA